MSIISSTTAVFVFVSRRRTTTYSTQRQLINKRAEPAEPRSPLVVECLCCYVLSPLCCSPPYRSNCVAAPGSCCVLLLLLRRRLLAEAASLLLLRRRCCSFALLASSIIQRACHTASRRSPLPVAAAADTLGVLTPCTKRRPSPCGSCHPLLPRAPPRRTSHCFAPEPPSLDAGGCFGASALSVGGTAFGSAAAGGGVAAWSEDGGTPAAGLSSE